MTILRNSARRWDAGAAGHCGHLRRQFVHGDLDLKAWIDNRCPLQRPLNLSVRADGQATIPFPIPDSEYDHIIGLLEDMDIGSPTGQDCRVDRLDSQYPILNRLTTQNVNVDELDYLAT